MGSASNKAASGPLPNRTDHESHDPLNVIVNYQTWLPLTETWIYNQVAHLPADVVPHVVCGARRNPDHFPVKSLHCYEELSRWRRFRVLTQGIFRCGPGLRRRNALIADVRKRFAAKVVHSHFGYTGYYSAAAIKRLGLSHVVTFYGVDMSAMPQSDSRWLSRYRELFAMVDRVLCEGPHMAEQVHRLGCPRAKLRVHHLGVNLTNLPYHPRQWMPGEPLRILVSASFREKKGIPLAIKAVAKIAKKIPVELTIVGDAGLNPKSIQEKGRIIETIRATGMGSEIKLPGYLSHSALLEQAYRHHIFLSPSLTALDGDSEGGAPVTLIEMAATGMPIVSTRHADIPEVIVDRHGGLLAEECDVDGVAANLEWLADNPDQWGCLVRFSRDCVETDFDAVTQGSRLAEMYRDTAKCCDRRHLEKG